MDPSLILVALATIGINLPFGYWRAATRKFSLAWFAAIHAAVPLVVVVRGWAGVSLAWTTAPVLMGAYFLGQSGGAWIRARRTAGTGDTTGAGEPTLRPEAPGRHRPDASAAGAGAGPDGEESERARG